MARKTRRRSQTQIEYNTAQPVPVPIKRSRKFVRWFEDKWRPMMAWQYIFVCLFDFLLAPVLTGWFAWKTGIAYVPWKPISLSEGGLYHMSMLVVLGVATWSRGQEKMRVMELTGQDPERVDLNPPPGFAQDAPLNVPPGYPDPAASVPPPGRTNPNTRF